MILRIHTIFLNTPTLVNKVIYLKAIDFINPSYILDILKMRTASLFLLCLLPLLALSKDKEEGKEDMGTVIGIDLGTTYSW